MCPLNECNVLRSEEILGVSPRELLLHVIRGVKHKYGFSISFMLDVSQSDERLSMGTGYEFVTDNDTFEDICRFLRDNADTDISKRCPLADVWGFKRAKEKVLRNDEYRGEPYLCRSCQLLDFVVPIYERESRTFIGVIFGCQKRPQETRRQMSARLRKFVSKEGNEALAPHSRKLRKLYARVAPASEDEIANMMAICDSIAGSIGEIFKFYIKQKTLEARRLDREKAIAATHRKLVAARDIEQFWSNLRQSIDDLALWVPFDWCILLRRKNVSMHSSETDFEILAQAGFGISLSVAPLVNRLCEVPIHCFHEMKHGGETSGALKVAVQNSVSPQVTSWAFSICDINGDVIGCLLFGCASEHLNAGCNPDEVRRRTGRIQELVNIVSMQYRVFAMLRDLKRREGDLLAAQTSQRELIAQLQSTLLTLNHQLHRPLFMIRGALSNVRDMYMRHARPEHMLHIELGMDIAAQTALMCRGLSTVLAIEQGGAPQGKVKEIDAGKEIRALAQAMCRAQDWTDKSFSFFEQSPIIRMNEQSFLFVFYVLIDNALKYGAAYSMIEFGFSEERSTGEYAFKVKSKGLRISPSDAENVFRKFWRHEKARQYDELGLGIGCWAAREHMRRCGGKLYLEVSDDLSIFIVVPPENVV